MDQWDRLELKGHLVLLDVSAEEGVLENEEKMVNLVKRSDIAFSTGRAWTDWTGWAARTSWTTWSLWSTRD